MSALSDVFFRRSAQGLGTTQNMKRAYVPLKWKYDLMGENALFETSCKLIVDIRVFRQYYSRSEGQLSPESPRNWKRRITPKNCEQPQEEIETLSRIKKDGIKCTHTASTLRYKSYDTLYYKPTWRIRPRYQHTDGTPRQYPWLSHWLHPNGA